MTTRTSTRSRLVRFPEVGELPPGAMVTLPGRGSTFVTETGERGGPPLLLLHGLACTGLLNWYPALPSLAEHHHVVVFDQRWHGRGIRSPRFTLEDCADDVVAVADALGIDRFIPVGYSMGSLVAQLVGHLHPDRTAGLVLAAAAPTFRRRPRERMVLDAFARSVNALRAGPGAQPGESPAPNGDANAWVKAQFLQTAAGAISRATAVIGQFDASSWASRLDMPTAFVVTAQDRLIPVRRQRWLAGQIRDSAVYEIPAGHAAGPFRPDVFAPALISACASVTARVE
ncbi:alpha/beta hydrolase [Speluncibacter jeojiensis]|uniref:Alpha/beta hydrolase n=1 Tax=Speluncibacter jeojiensis TaxID=2710754 RepID=A0A9X4RFP3_9ACTN|nr:alpha/beta hydrolase [Corynebacteriales bacterium D3-21]